MKKAILVVGLCVSGFTFAQNYVNQVIILNEGYYDYQTGAILEPVTIGSYNPTTQQYQVVDTLENMRFASDLVIDGNFYYVAADAKIYKMDLNTHQEIAYDLHTSRVVISRLLKALENKGKISLHRAFIEILNKK